jgi:hypothetical protein
MEIIAKVDDSTYLCKVSSQEIALLSGNSCNFNSYPIGQKFEVRKIFELLTEATKINGQLQAQAQSLVGMAAVLRTIPDLITPLLEEKPKE